MAVQLTGAPKTIIGVSDQTNLLAAAIGGIICVQGETLRGEPGKAVFVGSSGFFRRQFGGLHPDSPFPLYCIRMLDAGAKLYVSRAAHYADINSRGTATGTKATGGLTVAGSTTASFTGKFAGAGYNGATVQIVAPSSFQPGYVDLQVTVPESDDVQTVRDVKTTMTAGEGIALNQKLTHVNYVSGTLSEGVVVLAGGSEDVSAITSADYIGSAQGSTGWNSFSSVTDAYRIANIHRPVPAIDAGLASYAAKRGDVRFHLGFPLGANAVGLEDYRMGTGAYSHTAINTWMGNFIGGETLGTNGLDMAVTVPIPGIVEALPNIARKDVSPGPWYSAAGFKRGKVLMYTTDVPYNLLSADNQADFDRIYVRGINAIVKDDVEGPVLWGNRSALLDNTKVTSKENVADLILYLIRTFKPLFRREQFDPNNPKMWRTLFRAALPIITDLEQREAIEPGEGSGWVWNGDQDAYKRSDATYNTQADLMAGKYRARFMFKPISATEFLALDLVVADSGSFSILLAENSTF